MMDVGIMTFLSSSVVVVFHLMAGETALELVGHKGSAARKVHSPIVVTMEQKSRSGNSCQLSAAREEGPVYQSSATVHQRPSLTVLFGEAA